MNVNVYTSVLVEVIFFIVVNCNTFRIKNKKTLVTIVAETIKKGKKIVRSRTANKQKKTFSFILNYIHSEKITF